MAGLNSYSIHTHINTPLILMMHIHKMWAQRYAENITKAMMHTTFSPLSLARNLMYVHCLHNYNEKCHKSIGRIWYRSVEYQTHTYIAISSLHFMQMGFISNGFMPPSKCDEYLWVFQKITNTHSMKKFFIFLYLSKNLWSKDLNCFSIKTSTLLNPYFMPYIMIIYFP